MPSVARSYTMPSVIIRTPSPQVAFANNPVQSISRPANTIEQHAINKFETHAAHCNDCRKPYEAYQQGYRLCRDGNRIAREVTASLHNIDDVTYSKTAYHQERVEMQPGCAETQSLLKANERSMRRHNRPFVVPRRSHASQPKLPERRKSVKIDHQPRSQSQKHKRHSQIVEWPDHATTYVNNTATPHRGSLYDEDIRSREQQTKYNLEVRVPTDRRSGYYR